MVQDYFPNFVSIFGRDSISDQFFNIFLEEKGQLKFFFHQINRLKSE